MKTTLKHFKKTALTLLPVVILMTSWMTAANESEDVKDIADISLEELINIEVVSVSKKADVMQDAATSIYVLTEDDIRRSGATRLTELLAMVPGTWFREFTWGFTYNGVRSPADEFPQSMLVLLDGVPIQTSITGGPLYSYLEIPVSRIAQIEVIKGPGGTIYGSNANTGIISIFTKTAAHSDGLYVRLDGGLQNYVAPFIQYGGQLSEKVSLSAYVNYSTTRGYDKTEAFKGEILTVNGQDIFNNYPGDATDNRKSVSTGLNVQADLSGKIKSTTRLFYSSVKSDVYTSSLSNPTPWVANDGGSEFILSQRLDAAFNEKHNLFVNAFYRNQKVEFSPDGGYKPAYSVMDFEVQDNLRLGSHELSFGGNYRIVRFDIGNNLASDVIYLNPKKTETLYGFFIQDKISIGKAVDLTLGVKGETWTLVGNTPEFSPSARLMVKPGSGWRLWGAVSRSVTTPGFFHTNLERRIYDLGPDLGMPPASLYIALIPGEAIKPTEYLTCEFGFRKMFGSSTYLDVSGFYASFDNAIGLDDDFMSKAPVPSMAGDYLVFPVYFTNIYKGRMYGGEAVARFSGGKRLKVELSYSLYKITGLEGLGIPGVPGSTYTPPQWSIPVTPEHIIRLRPYINFPEIDLYLTVNAAWSSKSYNGQPYNYLYQVQDDAGGIYVDEPSSLLKLDFNIEKRFAKAMKGELWFNVWGRNILNGTYVEFYSTYLPAGYPHTVHPVFGGGLSWRF